MRAPIYVVVLVALGTLVVGLASGYFLGRWALDREWRQPLVIVGADDQARSAANDADPTPKAGTKVLRRMPLQKTEEAIAQMTAADPIKVRVGAVGRGDE